MMDYNSPDQREDNSSFADSTLQPPPNDDGTLASEALDSPMNAGGDHDFEIGEPGDEEAPVDLRDSGMSLPDPEELKVHRSANEGCLKMWVRLILGVLCIIALTAGIAVGIKKKQQTPASTNSGAFVPVVREKVRTMMETYIVANGVTNANDFSSSTSPQSKALDFLANEDPMQLNSPSAGLSSDEGYKFITRYVLTVLHGALGGDLWNIDMLFKSRHDTCQWYAVFQPPLGKVGVSCDKTTNKISGLLFYANGLDGTLPSELAVLTTLTHFQSIGNKIQGRIPDRYQELTNLENAVFAFNSLTGSIPGWINKWSNLQLLYTSNNALTGSIPNSLVQLSRLRVLALDNNLLTGPVSSAWKLPSLEYIFMEGNQFEGNLPSSITATNPLLINLDLSSNQLVGNLPSDLFRLSQLEIIDLHENSFGGEIPTDITGGNNALRFVALYDNIIGGSIPTRLGLLGQLEHLDLATNRLQGDIPTELRNLDLLTYLFLGENQFNTGTIPTFIYTYSSLKELSLRNTRRTGQISEMVGNLGDLVLLDLANNRLTGPIPSEIGAIGNLECLLLNHNTLSQQVPLELSTLNNMLILLLDNNNVTGSIEPMCAQPLLEIAIADCEELFCPCCNPCCTDGGECLDSLEVTNLDPMWERGYARQVFVVANTSTAPNN